MILLFTTLGFVTCKAQILRQTQHISVRQIDLKLKQGSGISIIGDVDLFLPLPDAGNDSTSTKDSKDSTRDATKDPVQSDQQKGDQLWQTIQIVKMMMDASYTPDELISAVMSGYYPSIRELTFVMYHAYYETAKGKTDDLPWAKNFHSIITKKFHAEGASLEQLLKNTDGIIRNYECDVREIFAFQYFFLKTKATDDTRVAMFKNLVNAGYLPPIIYEDLILQTRAPFYNYERDANRQVFWTPFFCKGMKESLVPPGEVVKALVKFRQPGSAFTSTEIITYLKNAGYTTAEVMDGMRWYTK